MSRIKTYNRLVAQHGSFVIIVKELMRLKNDSLRKIFIKEDIYLHSLKVNDLFAFNEKVVIAIFYCKESDNFFQIPFELKDNEGIENIWKCVHTHEQVQEIILKARNQHDSDYLLIFASYVLTEANLTDFDNEMDLIISSQLTDFLPKSTFKERLWNKETLKTVFSAENFGIVTNELINKLHTDEENYYLHDDRKQSGTQNGISSVLNTMDIPNKESITGIELNGAFRISYKL